MTIQEYSQDFQTLMDSKNSLLDDTALRKIRDGYFVVFVRGFLGNIGASFPGGYFQSHKKWLDNQGINTYIIDKKDGFDTENEPSFNVLAIKKVVENFRAKHPDQKILFVTHSKGGIDILAALLEEPSLKNDVGGWIAIQTPFEGTTLANIATFTFIIRFIISRLLQLLGGSKNGLLTLRSDVRKAVMQTSINEIEGIVKQIPVLTFGSSFDNIDRGILSTTMQLQSKMNDGVVPLDGTLLKKDGDPLCSYIKAKPIDHLETVIKNNMFSFFKPKFDHQRFLKVLLKVWLENGSH